MSEFLRRWKSLLLLEMEAQDAAAGAASEVPKGTHQSSWCEEWWSCCGTEWLLPLLQ